MNTAALPLQGGRHLASLHGGQERLRKTSGPSGSFSRAERALERANPGPAGGVRTLPQLNEVPLVGEGSYAPQVDDVKIQIALDNVHFEAALIAGPEGMSSR